MILILITAGLGWYSNQGTNNPFAPKNHLLFQGTKNGYTLSYVRGNRKHRFTTVVIPTSKPLERSLRPVKSGEWDLISMQTGSVKPELFSTAPQVWTVLSTELSSNLPKPDPSWPPPIFSQQASSNGQIIARSVSPLQDQRRAMLLTPGTMLILICDSTILENISSETYSPFKEKLDLLVLPSTSLDTVKMLRSIFRPKQILVTPPSPLGDGLQNIICAPDSMYLDFILGPGNTLELNN